MNIGHQRSSKVLESLSQATESEREGLWNMAGRIWNLHGFFSESNTKNWRSVWCAGFRSDIAHVQKGDKTITYNVIHRQIYKVNWALKNSKKHDLPYSNMETLWTISHVVRSDPRKKPPGFPKTPWISQNACERQVPSEVIRPVSCKGLEGKKDRNLDELWKYEGQIRTLSYNII